ncbi:MAG: hypothetical protein H6882_06700 [Rhodobiaceae bacterium]|nr:hypothetical protein [Rhodobiaceae bacterium]
MIAPDDMAKRLHAMLDLEAGLAVKKTADLHNLIDRIQYAAGPVPSILTPLKSVYDAADALYRMRTLVVT